jgi:hypothetical protein
MPMNNMRIVETKLTLNVLPPTQLTKHINKAKGVKKSSIRPVIRAIREITKTINIIPR